MRACACAAFAPAQSAKKIVLFCKVGLVVLAIFDGVTTHYIKKYGVVECEMTMHAYQQTPWKVT